MARLTIKKRGHSWVLLEGRLGIDAFPTKARTLDEKRLRKLWAGEQPRQLQHADQKPTQLLTAPSREISAANATLRFLLAFPCLNYAFPMKAADAPK
ncbi:MAG: hypothetical protein WB755_02345 [Terriglobales bacterium]|jgi:hypothetical protein